MSDSPLSTLNSRLSTLNRSPSERNITPPLVASGDAALGCVVATVVRTRGGARSPDAACPGRDPSPLRLDPVPRQTPRSPRTRHGALRGVVGRGGGAASVARRRGDR